MVKVHSETELDQMEIPLFMDFVRDCKTKMFRIGDLAATKKKELTAALDKWVR